MCRSCRSEREITPRSVCLLFICVCCAAAVKSNCIKVAKLSANRKLCFVFFLFFLFIFIFLSKSLSFEPVSKSLWQAASFSSSSSVSELWFAGNWFRIRHSLPSQSFSIYLFPFRRFLRVFQVAVSFPGPASAQSGPIQLPSPTYSPATADWSQVWSGVSHFSAASESLIRGREPSRGHFLSPRSAAAPPWPRLLSPLSQTLTPAVVRCSPLPQAPSHCLLHRCDCSTRAHTHRRNLTQVVL